MKPGSVVHVELHSADPAKSREFYGEIFGWKFADVPEMEYITWKSADAPFGGLMTAMEGRPPQVLNYLSCENIDETVDQIRQAGGVILQEKMEIPQMGWWAMFQEPGGTTMAIFQAIQPPRAARRRRAAPRKAAKKASRRKGRK